MNNLIVKLGDLKVNDRPGRGELRAILRCVGGCVSDGDMGSDPGATGLERREDRPTPALDGGHGADLQPRPRHHADHTLSVSLWIYHACRVLQSERREVGGPPSRCATTA